MWNIWESICNLEYFKDWYKSEKYLEVNWSRQKTQYGPNLIHFVWGFWGIRLFQPIHLVGQ